MIHVIADIRVAPGRRDEFLEEFRRLTPAVHAEQGCLEYGPTLDAATNISVQRRLDDVVTVVEKWASLAALEAHLAAPHMNEYRERVKDMVTGVELRILEPA
ncbi:MAG: antibiotic biosynthesis monooxygenase [Planctomycetaceae bacterium]